MISSSKLRFRGKGDQDVHSADWCFIMFSCSFDDLVEGKKRTVRKYGLLSNQGSSALALVYKFSSKDAT